MHRRLLFLATAAIAMVACSESPSPGREGGVAAPTATQAEKAKPTIRDRTLATMADIAENQLARINADELNIIETPMHCSLDSVNRVAPAGAVVPADSLLLLSGWAELATDDKSSGLIAVLHGEESFAFHAASVASREDLAKQLGKAAVTDLVASVSLEGVPAGSYDVFFVRKDEGGMAKCVADSKISIK